MRVDSAETQSLPSYSLNFFLYLLFLIMESIHAADEDWGFDDGHMIEEAGPYDQGLIDDDEGEGLILIDDS